ncbi:MAG: type III ribulose-bisphosphate carboxylase [Thermoproteota archaeon]
MSDPYRRFVELGYDPDPERDVIVVFRAVPAEGYSALDVAGAIAAESSVGTWTTLYTWYSVERVEKLKGRAYSVEDTGEGSYYVRVAYPYELFEEGNLAAFLASVAGNVYGMKRIKWLRVEDIYLPPPFVSGFKGPSKGIQGIRNALKVYGRPIVGTVPKPKVGYSPEEVEKLAYEILAGGMDFIKDDENLASPSYCSFEKRAEAVMKAIDRAEKETGERKAWLANITGDIREMERRLKIVADYGNPYVMVDVVLAGWSAITYIRDLAEEYGLAIHGHRAFHAAFTKNPLHGMSMFVLAKLYRLAGVDQLHVGVPGVGKMDARTQEVLDSAEVLRSSTFKPRKEDKVHLEQHFRGIKPALPVASGGLHPGVLPEVIKHMGIDIVIQVGGGVIGHPDGPMAGAAAVRQAIEAALRGVSLEEYAAQRRELKRALEKWGTRPHA